MNPIRHLPSNTALETTAAPLVRSTIAAAQPGFVRLLNTLL